MSALDIGKERAEFEAWWETDGQYGRAGGGQYEKTFAYNAWMYKAKRAAQPAVAADPHEAVLAEMRNPRWGEPDLYARLHHAMTTEFGIAKNGGKAEAWVSAAGALLEHIAREEGIAAHVSGQGGEDARDAARYRWLRNGGMRSYARSAHMNGTMEWSLRAELPRATTIDAAIDAAIAAKESGK